MKQMFNSKGLLLLSLFSLCLFSHNLLSKGQEKSQNLKDKNKIEQSISSETSTIGANPLSHLKSSGWVVFLTLLTLVILSIVSWAIFIGKFIYLKKLYKNNESFILNFWQSGSLENFAQSLGKYPYSPAKELFRDSYTEFQRNSSLQKKNAPLDLVIEVSINTLSRTLQKSRINQKKVLGKNLSFLAITASTAPFIGLFGTVWGIMTSFQAIAYTGNASLASVAPGISEALIATAFGLAAAIPSAIGYNFATNKIQGILAHLDGFSSDFINMIEKNLLLGKNDIK